MVGNPSLTGIRKGGDKGAAFYDAEHRQQQIKHLKRKAASLGYEVTPIPAAA
jgi:hypothetical protein